MFLDFRLFILYIFVWEGKGREGQREGTEREKGKGREGNEKREGKGGGKREYGDGSSPMCSELCIGFYIAVV